MRVPIFYEYLSFKKDQRGRDSLVMPLAKEGDNEKTYLLPAPLLPTLVMVTMQAFLKNVRSVERSFWWFPRYCR